MQTLRGAIFAKHQLRCSERCPENSQATLDQKQSAVCVEPTSGIDASVVLHLSVVNASTYIAAAGGVLHATQAILLVKSIVWRIGVRCGVSSEVREGAERWEKRL